MRSFILTAVAALAGYSACFFVPASTTAFAEAPAQTAPAAPTTRPAIKVYFSPNGGCTEAIVAELDAATKSVDVQAYSFTSAPIAEAVVNAKKRGLKVRVILDKSQRTERYSSLTFLRNAEVLAWVDAKHAIAHNKIMIIDGKTLPTGSFNFTKSAEKSNAENLLVIRDNPELIVEYQKNFEEHLAHSDEPATAPAASTN